MRCQLTIEIAVIFLRNVIHCDPCWFASRICGPSAHRAHEFVKSKCNDCTRKLKETQ